MWASLSLWSAGESLALGVRCPTCVFRDTSGSKGTNRSELESFGIVTIVSCLLRGHNYSGAILPEAQAGHHQGKAITFRLSLTRRRSIYSEVVINGSAGKTVARGARQGCEKTKRMKMKAMMASGLRRRRPHARRRPRRWACVSREDCD